MMSPEKASTLKLLREGMGKQVTVLSSVQQGELFRVHAQIHNMTEADRFPVLFLISSLAFLEALPSDLPQDDGWSPTDFLNHLKVDEGTVHMTLGRIRKISIQTKISLDSQGRLMIETTDRGQSSLRWISFVRGKLHLEPVESSEPIIHRSLLN